MTKIVWDTFGEKIYETGVDKGVLYLADGSGIPWNGLVSVNVSSENNSNTPIYFDGKKTFDLTNPGDFSAVLTAVTYPDEFSKFSGLANFNNGLFVDNQPNRTFGLSYRTYYGKDTDQNISGYKIHVMYNLTAIPEDIGYETIGSDAKPINFSWALTSAPEYGVNYRNSSHFVIDTSIMEPSIVSLIENILYGTESTSPRLPTINELLSYVLITITDNGDGTWTADGPDYFFSMLDSKTFQIREANAEYLDANTYLITSSNGYIEDYISYPNANDVIVDGYLLDDELILEKYDQTVINLGNIKGPQGATGPQGTPGGVPLTGGTMTGDLITTGISITDSDGTGIINLAAQSSIPSSPAVGNLVLWAKTKAGKTTPLIKGVSPQPISIAQIPNDRQWSFHSLSGTMGGTSTVSGTFTRTTPSNSYVQWTTAATASSQGILWLINPVMAPAASSAISGGFYMHARLRWPDASYDNTGASTGTRVWGICSSNTQGHLAQPRGGTIRVCGFNREHVDSSNIDTNWQFVVNNAAGITVVDTGMTFLVNKWYDQFIYQPIGSSIVYWQIDNVTDGSSVFGSTSAWTGPSGACQPGIYTINATARKLDAQWIYIETDR